MSTLKPLVNTCKHQYHKEDTFIVIHLSNFLDQLYLSIYCEASLRIEERL